MSRVILYQKLWQEAEIVGCGGKLGDLLRENPKCGAVGTCAEGADTYNMVVETMTSLIFCNIYIYFHNEK